MKYSLIGIIFFILINNTYAINQSSPSQNLQRLKESVVALNHTKEKSYKKQTQLNKTTHYTLYKEYGVFIDYLSFRIKSDCEQIIKHYGQAQIENLPCEIKTYQLDDNSYTTAEEATEGLEDELMQALGEFDEMLLKEEEMIAQTSNKRASNQGGGGSSSNASGSSNSDQENSGSEQANEKSETGKDSNSESKSSETEGEMSDKNSDSSRSQKQSGKGKGNKSARDYKRNKLDKIDDDIVARQLKEAAEAEKDPELKEKLWDEYYRYKQNTIK